MAANNGSAFGGLNGNTPWYNISGGLDDADRPLPDDHPHAGDRGKPGAEEVCAASLGTFPVTTPLFSTLLIGVIIIVGALTFFPALSLGPILEHLLMGAGKTF